MSPLPPPGMTNRWWPEHLGPLDGLGLGVGGSGELFPGDERLYSPRKLTQRQKLTAEARRAVREILQPEEKVLAVVPAMEQPGFLDFVALGILASVFHQVTLIFTDRRLLEVTMGIGGTFSNRIRSFPWSQVEDLRIGMRGLRLKAASRKVQMWQLRQRADKRLLKALVPRIGERAVGVTALPGRQVPLWHCPSCGTAMASAPRTCGSCGTYFRHRGMALWMALAVPGGGLFYAGHPILGFFDLLGEIVLYAFYVVLVLSSSSTELQDLLTGVGIGFVLLFLTKLESLHVSSVLVQRRTQPISPVAAGRWRRLAQVGTVVSLLAFLAPLAFAGSLSDLGLLEPLPEGTSAGASSLPAEL